MRSVIAGACRFDQHKGVTKRTKLRAPIYNLAVLVLLPRIRSTPPTPFDLANDVDGQSVNHRHPHEAGAQPISQPSDRP